MKRKTPMCNDWRPTIDCIQKLRAKYPRIDLEYYIEEARDGALSSGKMYVNFDAYFRNWIRRAGNFGPVVLMKSSGQQADVVDLVSRRQAKAKGIDVTGMNNSQVQNALFEHDTQQRREQ